MISHVTLDAYRGVSSRAVDCLGMMIRYSQDSQSLDVGCMRGQAVKRIPFLFFVPVVSLLVGLSMPVPDVASQEKPAPKVYHRGYKPLTQEKRAYYQAVSHAKHGGRIAMLAKNQTLPASFDCRTRFPLPVWDQGQCGSCYLDSTVRTATCALGAAGWGKPDGSFMLAAQYGMDRPRDFGGCDGGNGTEVIDWMIRNGWPAETYVDEKGQTHNDYPAYEARSGNDRTKPGAKMWMRDATWGYVNANGRPTVAEIKAALVNFGRLNIALDAGGQFGNGAGTITVLGDGIDHEINVAGYDDAKDGGSFLLENQWSADWGDNGCRWVTYKASVHIVDWFFVTAGPLPPPPPPVPPDPPIPPLPPTPGGKVESVTVTFADGSTQVFHSITRGMTLADLEKVLNRQRDALPPLMPVVPDVDRTWQEGRWRKQEEENKALWETIRALDTIQRRPVKP